MDTPRLGAFLYGATAPFLIDSLFVSVVYCVVATVLWCFACRRLGWWPL